jgi:hypothetical protein
MNLAAFERALVAAVALTKETLQQYPPNIASCRTLAVEVQHAAIREFGDSEIGRLGRDVRTSVHNLYGSKANFELLTKLLDTLSTHYGKQHGPETFEAALKLYICLSASSFQGGSERLPILINYLMGQASTQVGSASQYVERWKTIFPLCGDTISEHLVQQTRQAVESVLVKQNISSIAEVLDNKVYVFDYAMANILPEPSEGFQVKKSADLTNLLEGEFSTWYFLGFGDKLTEAHLHNKLQERGFPLYYERYLAHWLLQYGLLLLDAAKIGDWRQDLETATHIEADFVRVFEEYILTEANRAGVMDFKSYIDQLAGLRFHFKTVTSIKSFRNDFLRNFGLDQPQKLLTAIADSDYFHLSSMGSLE